MLASKPNASSTFIKACFASYLTGCLFLWAAMLINWDLGDELMPFALMASVLGIVPALIATMVIVVALCSLRLLRAVYFSITGALAPWIIILMISGKPREDFLFLAIVTIGGAVAGWLFWRISRSALIELVSESPNAVKWFFKKP